METSAGRTGPCQAQWNRRKPRCTPVPEGFRGDRESEVRRAASIRPRATPPPPPHRTTLAHACSQLCACDWPAVHHCYCLVGHHRAQRRSIGPRRRDAVLRLAESQLRIGDLPRPWRYTQLLHPRGPNRSGPFVLHSTMYKKGLGNLDCMPQALISYTQL